MIKLGGTKGTKKETSQSRGHEPWPGPLEGGSEFGETVLLPKWTVHKDTGPLLYMCPERPIYFQR